MVEGVAPERDVLSLSLRDRVAVVTGAGRGIGAATARLLAGAGAAVVCAARSGDELEALVAEICAADGEAISVVCDVSQESAIAELVAGAVERYGRLDLAFNNAGTDTHGRLHELSAADFDHVIAVNLRGTFLCLKYEIEAMLRTGGGAIVNTTSVGGVVAEKFIAPYIASKHGIVGLTKAAALEYAEVPIRVNCVAPGATRTELLLNWLDTDERMDAIIGKTPLGRLADPREVAAAAVFLLSDAASFITGATLVADGGLVVP